MASCNPPNCVPIGPSAGVPFSPAQTFPDIATLINVLTKNAMIVAGIIAFVFIIVGGFGIIMGAGSGDPKRMEQGKKMLTMAVVGLLVVVFSFWIIQLISLILGYNILELQK